MSYHFGDTLPEIPSLPTPTPAPTKSDHTVLWVLGGMALIYVVGRYVRQRGGGSRRRRDDDDDDYDDDDDLYEEISMGEL